MKLHHIAPPDGAVKRRKRVGRGTGSGHGKTATKGHKGQLARAGGRTQRGFEGGQMPLARRLPKRGFKNNEKIIYQVVNVADLNGFDAGATVTMEMLMVAGLVKKKGIPVKILGNGEMTKRLTVTAQAFSKIAAEKIAAAGGTATEADLV